MGNILFFGVIAFLAIMAAIGYSRGLVKTVFSLASVIIIIVVVNILAPTARMLIKVTPIYTTIQEKTEQFVYDCIGVDGESLEIGENPIAGLGIGEQKKVINELPIPQNLKDAIIDNNNEEGYNKLEVDNFADYIVMTITDMIVNSIAFIILLIVVVIAINTAIALLDIVSKLPVLNFFNKGGGAIFGFIEAMLIIWIVCIIITAFGTAEWGRSLLAEINDNAFLSFIYSNNILEKAITGWFGY